MFGLAAPHTTFYERQRGDRWIPYGDYVYRPVIDEGEALPVVEAEGWAGFGLANPYATFYERQVNNRWIPYGADPNAPCNTVLWTIVGFMLGAFGGQIFERVLSVKLG